MNKKKPGAVMFRISRQLANEVPVYLGQEQLCDTLASIDTVPSQAANFLSDLRRVFGLADGYQQLA